MTILAFVLVIVVQHRRRVKPISRRAEKLQPGAKIAHKMDLQPLEFLEPIFTPDWG
jgi:hypothetical protein